MTTLKGRNLNPSNAVRVLKNNVGMTLMEILIVMAILGAVMAVLTPMVMSRLDKSKVGSTKLAMNQIVQAIGIYYGDCGHYPKSLDGLYKADPDCSNWGPDPYLKKEIKDAWNNSFVYSVEGSNYTLKSLGKDGREGGEGTAKDITNEE